MNVDGAKPVLLGIGDNYAVARWRNVLLSVWRGAPTVAAAQVIGNEYRRVMSPGGEKFGALVVIEAHVPLPDQNVRRAVAEIMAETSGSIACMTSVLEVPGLRGTAIRSVLTAIVLMSRAPYPTEVFPTVGKAAEWVAATGSPKSGPPLNAREIEDAVVAFRRAIEGRVNAHQVKL